TSAGRIIKLSDGRYRIDYIDSRGQRSRPAFATEQEARAALEQIKGGKVSGGFFAAGTNTPLSKLFDEIIKENERKGLTIGSQNSDKSVLDRVKSRWGKHTASFFDVDGMHEVQLWLDELSDERRLASGTLKHYRGALNKIFKLAVKKKLIAFNPMNEFPLTVPEKPKDAGKVMSLSEISALVRGALIRAKDDRQELTWCVRGNLALLGLLTGMRNEECAGLFWDCVNFKEREIYVRRINREDEGIVETTKTGQSGSIPMSPILMASLASWGERLESKGFELEGPVLRTAQAPIVKAIAI